MSCSLNAGGARCRPRRAGAVLILAAALLLPALCLPTAAGAAGLGLPSSRWGLGFGSLPTFRGVRLTLADAGPVDDTGLRVQLLWPRGEPQGALRGLGVGGLGLGADHLDGVALAGLGIGGGRLRGLGLAGLGMGCGEIEGVALAGLGIGADAVRGVALAGLGIGGDTMRGVGLAGLGIGGDTLTGVFAGGLGVGGDRLTGLIVGGLGVGGDRLTGLAAGSAIGFDDVHGGALALGYLRSDSLTGVGTGAFTRTGTTRGVTIGIFNHTRQLHGVQIGLLNYVGNNPRGLRLLPGINAHF